MSTLKEGPNPLRPYYIPPTVGEPAEPVAAPSSGSFPARHGPTGASSYPSRTGGVLADLDYKNYLDDQSQSVLHNVKELFDELLWKYTSVLMAQPFEVAKTILQAQNQDVNAVFDSRSEPRASNRSSNLAYDDQNSDSEDDDVAYFTSNIPHTPTSSYRGRGHNEDYAQSPLTPSPVSKKIAMPQDQLALRRPDSILETIGQLWQKDGVWGVWKGSNATFLYTVLQSLLENWSRSFLSAVLNVPDLGVKEDMDRLIDIASPYPWASVFVAGAAAVATGILLSPLDLVRTRLIMTPSASGQRRTLASLRTLPSYLCPSTILIPTALNSLIHPLLTLSTPLVLRTRFLIDSQVSPMTFAMAKFLASSASILIKLPIETVLRRGQMAVLTSQSYVSALCGKSNKMDTIVPTGRYYGVLGTMYHITYEEGSRQLSARASRVFGEGGR
ncbi:hypothetical protein CDD81_1043 [Ophiocordyceps australis]|uniref:Mitochondrial carrier protein n=1 Tax=Ophiocordyceps australis TaxID=1399860 RepID=A0A2C5Y138_9HYPO|nr:hypothetical protein CDD81_1043 [Ophiocordyceps australis]